MKIYTKTGDRGETSLYGGKRVKKHDILIEAIGDVDELNSLFGMITAKLLPDSDTRDRILRVQSELFALGAQLATPVQNHNPNLKRVEIKSSFVTALEKEIDKWQDVLPALHNFILPGGSELGAIIHHARAVCRRAERSINLASESYTITKDALMYINRLSDWLFTLARKVNSDQLIHEIVWASE